MTRRSPPSHLHFLPPHLPTPLRGAPKFHLPSRPDPLLTLTPNHNKSYASAHTHTRDSSISSISSESTATEAEAKARPPWVRSRSFDKAAEMMGVELKAPEGVVVMRRS